MRNTVKYYMLEKGHIWNEHTLYVFDSLNEREDKTREVIFGPGWKNDECPGWDKYLEELTNRGSLEFEGDPGLEWFTAWPAVPPAAQPANEDPEERFLAGYDYAVRKVEYWLSCHKRRGDLFPENEVIKCEIKDLTELLDSLAADSAARKATPPTP